MASTPKSRVLIHKLVHKFGLTPDRKRYFFFSGFIGIAEHCVILFTLGKVYPAWIFTLCAESTKYDLNRRMTQK